MVCLLPACGERVPEGRMRGAFPVQPVIAWRSGCPSPLALSPQPGRGGVMVGLRPTAVFYWSGPLAQSVEQKTFNLLVEGSNPSRPTISSNLTSLQARRYKPVTARAAARCGAGASGYAPCAVRILHGPPSFSDRTPLQAGQGARGGALRCSRKRVCTLRGSNPSRPTNTVLRGVSHAACRATPQRSPACPPVRSRSKHGRRGRARRVA